MQRRKTRIFAAIAVTGVLAAGGAAFTASNSFSGTNSAPIAGFGTTTVSGATIVSVNNTLSGDGTAINSTTLTLQGDVRSYTVTAGYGPATSGTSLTGCTVSQTLDGSNNTTATCDFTGSGAHAGIQTSTATNLNVAVTR